MLKLKLRYFGYLMQRADLLEKTMMLGKIKGRRRREWQRLKWLDSITDSIDLSLSKLWEVVKDREAWHAVVHRVTELDMTERLNNSNIMYYSCEIIVEVHFFFFLQMEVQFFQYHLLKRLSFLTNCLGTSIEIQLDVYV